MGGIVAAVPNAPKRDRLWDAWSAERLLPACAVLSNP